MRRFIKVRSGIDGDTGVARISLVRGGPWGTGERVEIAPGRLENREPFLGNRGRRDMMLGSAITRRFDAPLL